MFIATGTIFLGLSINLINGYSRAYSNTLSRVPSRLMPSTKSTSSCSFRIILKQNRLNAYINVFHFIIYRTNYGKHIFPTIFRLFGSWVECPSHHTLLHSPPSRKREHQILEFIVCNPENHGIKLPFQTFHISFGNSDTIFMLYVRFVRPRIINCNV